MIYLINGLDQVDYPPDSSHLWKENSDRGRILEERFRDLKSLFGFRHLMLKKPIQERVEILSLLVIIGMGLMFFSGYIPDGEFSFIYMSISHVSQNHLQFLKEEISL